jgi:hypothetical protein
MKRYLAIFAVAFSIRIITMLIFSYYFDNYSHKESDAKAHYLTSINLEVPKESQETIGYKDWWVRTPVYVLYLHITHQSLLLQILISAFTVLLLYKINPLAGWIFCFYPQSIILSFNFNKETLLWYVLAMLLYAIHFRFSRLSLR